MPEISLSDWNAFLSHFPDAHLLQTGEWGQLKSSFGWQAVYFVNDECGAQVLFRRFLFGLTLAYIPKGPVGSPHAGFWQELDQVCCSHRAIFLKVEPDGWLDTPAGPSAEMPPGFAPSPHSIQPRRTIVVDLDLSEEDILARMKQKCRYNIRLAEKKDIIVHSWDDIDAFYKMMTITAARDGFGSHSRDYYQRLYSLLQPAGLAELLVAEYAGQPLSALIVCARGRSSWYLLGASIDKERSRMPAYLLQWEAMRWARAHNAQEYDLWGVPDEDEGILESDFEKRNDGLWGVYRFKRGFGGRVRRAVQAYDRVYQPLLYQAYRLFLRGRS